METRGWVIKYLASALLVLVTFLSAFFMLWYKNYENPFLRICNMVNEKIFISDISEWYSNCINESKQIRIFTPNKSIIDRLNILFKSLNVSHLSLYYPQEAKGIWQSEFIDTGIESEFVDGELVVINIASGSPAETARLERGDLIKSINNEHPSEKIALETGGDFKIIKTDNTEVNINIVPQKYELNDLPRLTIENGHSKGIWVLKVPSFREWIFNNNKWTEILREQIQQANLKFPNGKNHVVLDLRNNIGGNFAAGLSLVSKLICKVEEIGMFKNPKAKSEKAVLLTNSMSSLDHKNQISRNKSILLKTDQDSCLNIRIEKVLVNSFTASTSEIVAQAMHELGGVKVVGTPTSRQVLVGEWFPVFFLGKGVYMSIPIATYASRKGRNIEQDGVELDEVKYYRLNSLRQKIDNWVFD